MPPRNNSGRQPIGTRKSARLQEKVSPKPPIPHVSQPQRRIKRKRLHGSETDESENVRPAKQPRTPFPSLAELSKSLPKITPPLAEVPKSVPTLVRVPKSVPSPAEVLESLPPLAKLTKKNLEKLSAEIKLLVLRKFKPVMGFTSDISMGASTETTHNTVSTSSQCSSSSAARYRYVYLEAENIHIHGPSPPADIQARIDAIIKAKVPEERRAELLEISHKFNDECVEIVRAKAGKNDYIMRLKIFLKAMDRGKLSFCDKANWQVELESTISQANTVNSYQQEVNDDGQDEDNISIKTPRPDITIGLNSGALISALPSRNLSKRDACDFLRFLRKYMKQCKPDGYDEPILWLEPTKVPNLMFPFFIVHGKAYSTGKPIFDAENQAAVSGTCGLMILHCLDELVEKLRTGSDILPTPEGPSPLLFSICTKGPVLELWAHYTIFEDGKRRFFMRLLKICNGVLLEGVVDFLTAVNNVLSWGTGEFLDGVVERLWVVERALRKQFIVEWPSIKPLWAP